MPPIPNTLDEEALQLVLSLERRQEDLSEFQVPRLRSCTGPLSLQQNLAAELREDIDNFSRQVEALDVLVGDQKGEKNRRELRQITDAFEKTLSSLRIQSREALLISKRTIDSQSKSRRDELLGSAAVSEKQTSKEGTTEDALMKASSDVTTALHRTIGLMQGELERSVLSTQMLDASTASLRSTSSTHDTLTNLMGTSKQLITALEKSDWLDRILIFSALLFFFLVVLFILKQRILDRGLRVAFWWTRFIPDFSGDSDILRMEEAGSKATTLAASVASSAAVTLSATTAKSAATLLQHSVAEALNSGVPSLDTDITSSLESVVLPTESSSAEPPRTTTTDIKLSPEDHIEL